jgi:phosphoserine phosphatase
MSVDPEALSPDALVATLIAGPDYKLSSDLIDKTAFALNTNQTAWLDPGHAADLFITMSVPLPDIYALARDAIGNAPCDVLIQPVKTRRKKLLIADMESTIIEQEMLDELADMIGLRKQVAGITSRAMNGELDFAAALRERVALLKSQPESILKTAAEAITHMPGASSLLATMKKHGAKSWLVSGGFAYFVEPVAKQLGFDASHANHLIVSDGVIIGEVANPILDKDSKRELMQKACVGYGLQISDALAVGDGANDVPMLKTCNAGGGFGVAFQAKPKVRGVIPHQINYGDLSALLYAQGYTRDEITSSSRT